LSSIVNGLVYFDQFTLISPPHLGLVVVGIIVLLAGVWVVSIQAGSGGVNVVRFKNGDEPLSDDEDTISIVSESSETEPRDVEGGPGMTGQSMLAQGREQQTVGPVRMERQTVSESHIQTPPPHLQIRPPTVDEIRTLPMPITSPSSSILHGHMTSESLLLSPSSVRAHRRRRSTLQPADTQHSLSPPLGRSSVIGGGLSIGLGPMSPGFSIVPLDRRRRTSGLGFTDVVEGVRGQRRRTVSEGDVRRLIEGVEGGGEADAVEETGNGGERSAEESAKNIANLRWNWLRKIFLGRG
jgi:magnesium transporter